MVDFTELLEGMDVPEERKTDTRWLLRNLSFRNSLHPNFLPAIRAIKAAVKAEKAEEQNLEVLDDPDFPLWFVGGCVRDWVQDDIDGKPRRTKHKDIDVLATHASSVQEIEDWLLAHGGKIFDHNRFNIIRGFLPGVGPVDMSPPRADVGIADGRRPESVILASPEQDLERRDFTVNAMAMTMGGELIDLHGGKQDLENRMLRFVGDPHERLREDAFRAFRALRFVVTKNFTLAFATAEALRSLRSDNFDATSTELMVQAPRVGPHALLDLTLELLHGVIPFRPILAVMQERDAIWLKPTLEQR